MSVCVRLCLRASVLVCLGDGDCTHALSAMGDCKAFDSSIAIQVSKNNKDKPGAECSAEDAMSSHFPRASEISSWMGNFFLFRFGEVSILTGLVV